MAEKKLICIDNTKFIWNTNFSGDPARDRFGSDTRKANVIIPDHNQAQELIDAGFNVKVTKPSPDNEDNFVPTYFVPITINYDTNWPPNIYLVSMDGRPKLLNENTVGRLDKVNVRNVNVVLNPYYNQRTRSSSLYVRTMYVEQDVESDPYASRYQWGANDGDADLDEDF